jgi:mannose-6-phosphate isomerase-like protein (cupin superfamily)
VHCPQLLDPLTETIGLITPGDWIDFFRFVCEKYDGVYTAEDDSRNPFATLGLKMAEISQKHDVVFQPQHVGANVSAWSESDHQLPPDTQPYYLQANRGPRYLLGGLLARPFITTAQSGGKFAIASIESSSKRGPSVLSKKFTFAKVHQVFHVLDGAVLLTVNGQSSEVRAGETAFVPKGTALSIDFVDNYVRFWVFSSGNGLETLVSQAGQAFKGHLVPDQTANIDQSEVERVAYSIGLAFH